MKIQKRESNKNLKTYLAKELNISLSESELICKVIKEYKQEKKQHLEEIDVKKAMVTGAMGLASILPSDKLDASSDYFTMQKTNLNAIESKVKGLSIPEQIKVYEDTLKLLPMGDNTTKTRITNILGELRAKLKQDRLSRGIYTRESKVKRRQELEEVSWKDVKDFGKKAIATTLLLSASFMPIAQDLYGDNSCNIDSSGEVVSCDASKLKSKTPTSQILITLKSGIGVIEQNINDPEYKEFALDDIQAVIKGLEELSSRPNLADKDKLEIQSQLKQINKLKKQLTKNKKENHQMEQTKFQKYLIEKLKITLSEAILLEKEVRNYSKIKKSFLKENENFIKYDERYKSELNSAKLYFHKFFTKYDSNHTKGNKEAIDKMKEVFKNNDIDYLFYNYPFADLYNLLHRVNNVKIWGIEEYPEIADNIEGLHYKFMVDFAELIKEDSNPNYFFLENKKYYSKKDFFLKIEDMSSKVLGKTLSQKFEEVFEDKLDEELM